MDAVANMSDHLSLNEISSESSSNVGMDHVHINLDTEIVQCLNVNTNMGDIEGQLGFSCADTDAVNNYMEGFLDERIFTQEDLYSVVEPGSASSGIAEIEDGSHWTNQPFIQLNPDAKQIQGGEVRNCTDTSNNFQPQYYHLMVSENRTGTPIENIPGDQGVSTNTSTNVQSSPIENDTSSSKQDVGSLVSVEATHTKVRKPRGRKPKAVKEREAAEAAAAEKNVDMSNKRSLRERAEVVPTVVLHHKAVHISPSIENSTPQLSLVNHENSIRNNNFTTNHLSLEKLAFQDRNAILARRNDVNDGNLSGSTNVATTCYQDSGSIQHAQATLRSQESYATGSPDAGDRDIRTRMSLRSNGYINRVPYQIQNGSSRLGLNGVASGSQPNLFNNVSQQFPEQQHANNNRLDQLVTSRISNIGGPKKSIVTPSYIQRNLGLYNQLTAPKKQSDFESRKFTQEKWKQYPNPSIIVSGDNHPTQIIATNENGSNRVAHQIFNNNPMQKQRDSVSNFTNGARCNNHDPNGNNDIPVGVTSAGNMQRNGGRYNSNIGLGGSNNETSAHGYSQNMFSRLGNNIPIRINNSLLLSNQLQELTYEKEKISQNNYELKVRLYSQMKLNRQLTLRLRCSHEENEVLKSQIGLHDSSTSYLPQMDFRYGLRRNEGRHNPYQYNTDDHEIIRDAWLYNQFKKEASNSRRREEAKYTPNAQDNNSSSALNSTYLSNIFDELSGIKSEHSADNLKRNLPMSPDTAKRLRMNKDNEKFQVEHGIANTNGRTNYNNGLGDDGQESLQTSSDSAGLCVIGSSSKSQIIGPLKIENEKTEYLENNCVPNSVSPKSTKSTNTAETEEVTDIDYGDSSSTTFNSPVNVGARANVFSENNLCFEGALRG